ncbi:Ff.00g099340.m01.CDS01 [Fusarium sp. VM40]|nr:Ff.00g099340.m01.CDS01 [Fusarium sp. VM40]
MSRSHLPPRNGMKSFWRYSTGPLDDHRSTEELPAQSDIVIIGAGYSGAALTTHILSECTGKSPSILVLEARQLCSGATGRNGGHLKPDSYNAISRLAKEYGVEAAAEVANFETANVEAVAEFVRQNDIDCDFIMTRAVDVQFQTEHHAKLVEGYRSLLDHGVEATKQTYAVPSRIAENVSGVKGAKGCFSYTAGHLWPYKLIHHIFTSAIANGVNIQTNTPVTTISSTQDSNGYWTLTTERGLVKTKKIIMATNAYTAALLPEYENKIVPYRAICSRIVVPKTKRAPLLTNTYALRFNEWDFDYLIPRPDGSIIVGGARQAYIQHVEDWYGSVNDTEIIERAKHYFDGYMQRHFHGWEASGAHVDDIWTGVMGYSSDRIPRIGAIPDRPGMYIMGGFTGHGMPQVFLCAKGLANMVLQQTDFQSTGIPRLFEESRPRLSDERNRILEMYEIPLQAFSSRL